MKAAGKGGLCFFGLMGKILSIQNNYTDFFTNFD